MISIIIPAYNEEKYIRECLESLKNQDYSGEYEIIVVNNSCTDNTDKIALELGARVIICGEKGVIYARQKGAEQANGDIIVQADADTVYTRDWLTRIDRYFNSDIRISAVAGFFLYKDPPSWSWLEYLIRKAANNLIGMPFLKRPLFVSGANFAFRKEAFEKIGGYHKGSLYPDQYGICSNLKTTGKIKYVPSLVAYTSSRRIEKPFIRVALDAIVNLFNVIKYFILNTCKLIRNAVANMQPVHKKTILAILILAGIIGYLIHGYVLPSSQAFGQIYYRVNVQEKVIALTFDDGPNDPYTSEILDILKENGVKATFFVIGRNAEINPDTAKRICAEGNVVGNHTYLHNANHALFDDGGVDIKVAQDAIQRVTGVAPHLYRPPHGKKSPWELSYLKKLNMVNITWSNSVNEAHDVLIFGNPKPHKMSMDIIDQIKPGDIILLHDGYGIDHNVPLANKECTVKIVSAIIEQLKQKGYRFVTVPELLGIPAYN
jgi:peptidoglycan-N-acetylglucosamine deacetylase